MTQWEKVAIMAQLEDCKSWCLDRAKKHPDNAEYYHGRRHGFDGAQVWLRELFEKMEK